MNVDDEADFGLAFIDDHPHGSDIMNQVDALTGQRMLAEHGIDQLSKDSAQLITIQARFEATVADQGAGNSGFNFIARVFLGSDGFNLSA